MFSETVIIFKDIVLSVILLKDDVRDIGGNLCRRLLCGRRRSAKEDMCIHETSLCHLLMQNPVEILVSDMPLYYFSSLLPRVPLSTVLLILVCRPVVDVMRLLASSSDSKNVVVSKSELRIEAVSYPWPERCFE